MNGPVSADEAEGPDSRRELAGIGVLTEATLADLQERRKYRGRAATAAGWILAIFAALAAIAAGFILYLQSFTPPAVGLVVAFVTATTVLTMAFLKATFSASKLTTDREDYPLPPGAEFAKKAIDEIVDQVRPKA